MCVSSIRSIGGVREVELVLDVADDLLEHVLERDDPVHVAVLVDDDRQVLLLAAEVGEERGEVLRLGNDVRGPDDRFELDGRDAEVVDRAEQIAHVEDAHDVVERLAIHGVPGVRRVDDCAQRFLGRHVHGDRNHVGTRHHHRRDLLRGEVEDLVEHLLLGLLELADVLGGGDAVPDVLSGVRDHPGRRGLDPQDAQDAVGRLLQQPDERMRDACEPVERYGEGDRQHLGLLEGDCLRNELTQHDGEIRQDRERDQEGDGGGKWRLEEPGEQRLADGTEKDRRHGDPDLNRRDEPNRVVHEAKRRPGAAAAALRPLLEPAAPPGDERVLGRHEDRIPQDQQEDDEDSQRCAHSPRGAPVLGGISSPIDQAGV